jgi:hypothetical protein
LLIAAGCGSGTATAPTAQIAQQGVSVDVQPGTAQVLPGGTIRFAAAVTGAADTSVAWTVDEPTGGGVDTAGLYTAPAATGTFHVRATSRADATAQAIATVTVTPTPVVAVAVSPKTPTVPAGGALAFSATVTGSTNQGVTWRVQEATGCGTITAAGAYTAPAAGATCHVVATSVADATKSDVATVTVTPPVTVAVSPRTPTVAAGGAIAFSATVTGTTNQGVTWRVQEATGCGTITAAGAYTAPGAAATCHVVATSVVDTTKSDVATVTVTAPTPVAVTLSPASATVDGCRTVQFTASVTGTTDTRVTWSVQEAASGTVSTAGLYTAPNGVGTAHVVATSVADPTKTAIALVTVNEHVLSVAVSPQTISVPTGGTAQFTATVTTTCGSFASVQTVSANGTVTAN